MVGIERYLISNFLFYELERIFMRFLKEIVDYWLFYIFYFLNVIYVFYSAVVFGLFVGFLGLVMFVCIYG